MPDCSKKTLDDDIPLPGDECTYLNSFILRQLQGKSLSRERLAAAWVSSNTLLSHAPYAAAANLGPWDQYWQHWKIIGALVEMRWSVICNVLNCIE